MNKGDNMNSSLLIDSRMMQFMWNEEARLESDLTSDFVKRVYRKITELEIMKEAVNCIKSGNFKTAKYLEGLLKKGVVVIYDLDHESLKAECFLLELGLTRTWVHTFIL